MCTEVWYIYTKRSPLSLSEIPPQLNVWKVSPLKLVVNARRWRIQRTSTLRHLLCAAGIMPVPGPVKLSISIVQKIRSADTFMCTCQEQTSLRCVKFRFTLKVISYFFDKRVFNIEWFLFRCHFPPASVYHLFAIYIWMYLQWRHNECDDASNHQSHDHLLNRLLRRRSEKTSRLRVTGLCVGNSPHKGQYRGKYFYLMTS